MVKKVKFSISKLCKYLAIGFWFVPVVLAVAFSVSAFFLPQNIYHYSLIQTLAYFLFSGPMLIALYAICFLVSFPYWFVLALSQVFLYQKQGHNNEYHFILILFFDLCLIFLSILLVNLCDADYYCRTSDAPLGSGYTLIVGLFLSWLFGTLPFVVLIHRSQKST